MRNNDSTLPGVMLFPDDDTPVLSLITGLENGLEQWNGLVSISSFHCNIQLYCVVIYLLTYS